jgi:hypothetical protein
VTRASTLVCDPNIKITTRSAYAFGGVISLEAAPSKYDKGVGNLDKEYVSFMIYNYAVQQAGWDIVGEFRPYLLFGVLTGNATLDADPLNPVGGTVPKPSTEIAAKLVGYDLESFREHKLIRYTQNAYISSGSKTWMAMSNLPNDATLTVDGQLIHRSLVITAALPQVIASTVLYLILGTAALIISLRTPGAPFTLAGILMMRSKLAALQMSTGSAGEDEEKDRSSEQTSEIPPH